MRLLERIEQTQKLWAVMLPRVPAPDPAWIGRWCSNSNDIVEHAIIRASKKYGQPGLENVNPEMVWRYASGVMVNEGKRKKVLEAA